MRANDLRTRFWRFVTRCPDIDRVVRVVTLWPEWDERMRVFGWPTLLVDRGVTRETIIPLWTRARWMFWRKPEDDRRGGWM